MTQFSAQEERFFMQVREVGTAYKKANPDLTPYEFERLIPRFMRKVLDRQAYIAAQFKGDPDMARVFAEEVYNEIRESVHS